MEITESKLAILVIGIMAVIMCGFAYIGGKLDGSTILAIFSTGAAGIAGLAGYDMLKARQQP